MNVADTNALPAEVLAQLDALRDIHLPPPIGWWPLAPGWWVLTALLLASLLAAAVLHFRYRRSLKYAALRELEALKVRNHTPGAVQELVVSVAILVRRVALSLPDGKRYARVYGQAWHDFLVAAPHGMSPPVAELLAQAPYRAATDVIPSSDRANVDKDESVPLSPGTEEIVDSARHWIRRHA